MPTWRKDNYKGMADLGQEIGVSSQLQTVLDAERAIHFLIDRGNFWSGTKEQFAFAMEWVKADGSADRRRVENVCNLTRDQDDLSDWIGKTLGGFLIAYAPSDGGMTLVDPSASEMPLDHFVHVLAGDVQRQKQHKTENRRRIPTWTKAGQAAMNGGDAELARLCWQAENEVNSAGFVSDTTAGQLFSCFVSRGLYGS